MNAATRTTVVLGTGVVAGVTIEDLPKILAGIPIGIAAGATYDAINTVIDGQAAGIYAVIKYIMNYPSVGIIFDAFLVPIGDGLGGYVGVKAGKQIKANSASQQRIQANTDSLTTQKN